MEFNIKENMLIVDAVTKYKQMSKINFICSDKKCEINSDRELDVARSCLGRYQTYLENNNADKNLIDDVSKLYDRIHIELFPVPR